MIYLEGSYVNTFSGNPHPTPYYEYNQIMYRLPLSESCIPDRRWLHVSRASKMPPPLPRRHVSAACIRDSMEPSMGRALLLTQFVAPRREDVGNLAADKHP